MGPWPKLIPNGQRKEPTVTREDIAWPFTASAAIVPGELAQRIRNLLPSSTTHLTPSCKGVGAGGSTKLAETKLKSPSAINRQALDREPPQKLQRSLSILFMKGPTHFFSWKSTLAAGS